MGKAGCSIAAWLVLAAAWAPPGPPESHDRAGNRIVAFPAVAAAPDRENSSERHCTDDRRWCAQLERARGAKWRLRVIEAGMAPIAVDLPQDDYPDLAFSVWPGLVVEPDGAIQIGVQRRRWTGFAGGGAGDSDLVLLRLDSGTASPVLETLIAGAATIRACFSEEDFRTRQDSCVDEYSFAAELRLDPENESGRPRFILVARARTFPGSPTREADSRRALSAADLVWATDAECSYRRRFDWDPASAQYRADAPLPTCDDYRAQ